MSKQLSVAGLILFFVVPFFSVAQTGVSPTPLKSLLCKKWVLDKLEDNGTTISHAGDPSEFDLIFYDDGTVKQGMSPDGYITGTWAADDKQMTVTISDLSVKTAYSIKIIRI